MAPRWRAPNTTPQILIAFMPVVVPAGLEKNLRMPHPKLARHASRRLVEINRQLANIIILFQPRLVFRTKAESVHQTPKRLWIARTI